MERRVATGVFLGTLYPKNFGEHDMINAQRALPEKRFLQLSDSSL